MPLSVAADSCSGRNPGSGWQARCWPDAGAVAAAAQGITPFAAGIGDDPAAIEWFPTVFWNHYSGPDALYQALTGEIPFSDPVFVEAIELFNNYVQKG